MITVTKKEAKQWLKDSVLPEKYVGKIGVVMKRQDAENWLKHLTSGRQKQTENVLYGPIYKDDEHGGLIKDGVGFCCLGLEQACNWGGKVEASGDGRPRGMPTVKYLNATGKGYFNADGELDQDPWFASAGDTASSMNDSGATFKQIAKALRKSLAVYD